MTIEMKLYENALSSLEEGLRCWKQAKDGKPERYKFAVLHIARHFELALKYVVYFMHPLLVYKKPYSKNLEDALTISPEEAFYIIKNSQIDTLGEIEFEEDEIKPLRKLKKVRNAIEHFVSDLTSEDVEEVEENIILFMETASSMANDRADTGFAEYLADDVLEIYSELMGEE